MRGARTGTPGKDQFVGRRLDRKSTRLNSSPCNLVCRLLLEKKKNTSELQSPCNLVCRLLLEQKKHNSELPSPSHILSSLILEHELKTPPYHAALHTIYAHPT